MAEPVGEGPFRVCDQCHTRLNPLATRKRGRGSPPSWGSTAQRSTRCSPLQPLRHYVRGASIYPQGTHRGSIFIVLAGEVSVSVVLPNGQRILCVLYQPGTVFGFPIVEGERPRLSAADAFTAATVAVVPRREFEHILAGLPPAILIRFFNRVLERQARFAMRLVHCAALDLRGRLALTIADLAATFGVREARGHPHRPTDHARESRRYGRSLARAHQQGDGRTDGRARNHLPPAKRHRTRRVRVASGSDGKRVGMTFRAPAAQRSGRILLYGSPRSSRISFMRRSASSAIFGLRFSTQYITPRPTATPNAAPG